MSADVMLGVVLRWCLQKKHVPSDHISGAELTAEGIFQRRAKTSSQRSTAKSSLHLNEFCQIFLNTVVLCKTKKLIPSCKLFLKTASSWKSFEISLQGSKPMQALREALAGSLSCWQKIFFVIFSCRQKIHCMFCNASRHLIFSQSISWL